MEVEMKKEVRIQTGIVTNLYYYRSLIIIALLLLSLSYYYRSLIIIALLLLSLSYIRPVPTIPGELFELERC
jgi:hypothetical protein